MKKYKEFRRRIRIKTRERCGTSSPNWTAMWRQSFLKVGWCNANEIFLWFLDPVLLRLPQLVLINANDKLVYY